MHDTKELHLTPHPRIHALDIQQAFQGLSEKEKNYAHYMSRAAWHGTRIILRQVSVESVGIFDLIMELYNFCSGNWNVFLGGDGITRDELGAFLDYAATFLSNIGNYYGTGDQKFIPKLSSRSLQKMAAQAGISSLCDVISEQMLSIPPFSLGYPGIASQSAYYPSEIPITAGEIDIVSRALEERSIYPENTRIRKTNPQGAIVYDILQASVDTDTEPLQFQLENSTNIIRIIRGDHSKELQEICNALNEASKYAANDTQRKFLSEYIASFRTGSLHDYRDSQRTWISDKSPHVENIFGFVEPYRDPSGIRSEFEGLVAISHPEETNLLRKLVGKSATFIRRLPWATGNPTDNDGKGPFEKSLFEPPDFTSIHALAYCSSIIFPGINLPNYNDIRQDCGFKNVIIANRMSTESNKAERSPFLDPSETETFQNHKFPAYYWWVVLHELFGHGTGKMMVEESVDKFNFDIKYPPVDPTTGKPITSWYKPGQTWTGQFADLATTIDECRAELVGAYLMDDEELLSLIGFTDDSEISADDLLYNLYLQLGIDGLRGLQNFNLETQTWGQAHSRAHFAMLKCLLNDGGGFLTIECNPAEQKLIVRVDRSKILTHGKPALGGMLLKLHMYRCTADVAGCRSYYENLSRVDNIHLQWRDIVLSKNIPKWVFVQANTFVEGEKVILKEYEPTVEGVIQSWIERKV
ncbi:peptidase family M49-domain-containing protein [Xylogone sp. PMI_703]|nr:peptidase family M49-domain-containing protein [Xylogone sp. PMI_703]